MRVSRPPPVWALDIAHREEREGEHGHCDRPRTPSDSAPPPGCGQGAGKVGIGLEEQLACRGGGVDELLDGAGSPVEPLDNFDPELPFGRICEESSEVGPVFPCSGAHIGTRPDKRSTLMGSELPNLVDLHVEILFARADPRVGSGLHRRLARWGRVADAQRASPAAQGGMMRAGGFRSTWLQGPKPCVRFVLEAS